MSGRAAALADVTLAPVDEEILARLVAVATTDADASEVTPPLTPGDEWTPQRVAWFEEYHRSRRAGLTGSKGEATWAILESGSPVGSVRLKGTEADGVLETGIWLARSARGRGIGVQAMRLIREEARACRAKGIRADTTRTNDAAQALMRAVGFALSPDAPDGRVHGILAESS